MSRPLGRRNADFEASREQILDRLLKTVSQNPDRSSFADLAEMSGISRTTLRHYFGSREDLLDSLLAYMAKVGEQVKEQFPDDSDLPLLVALRRALDRLLVGWRLGVGALFTAGLLWGLGDERLGPAYVRSLLEPLLVSFEARLLARLRAHEMDEEKARYAALALVSPVVLALLHQDPLHGASCRPLDIQKFLDEHLMRFARGWGLEDAEHADPAGVGSSA